MGLRASVESRIEHGIATLITVVVGIALMAGGAIGAAWTLEHAKDGHADHAIMYLCVAVAILGALILPGIFTVVKPVLVFIFPNGIPLLGGKRAGDPPLPPPPQP